MEPGMCKVRSKSYDLPFMRKVWPLDFLVINHNKRDSNDQYGLSCHKDRQWWDYGYRSYFTDAFFRGSYWQCPFPRGFKSPLLVTKMPRHRHSMSACSGQGLICWKPNSTRRARFDTRSQIGFSFTMHNRAFLSDNSSHCKHPQQGSHDTMVHEMGRTSSIF